MLCAPSIHCCICCLVRARLYQSIDRLAWSSLISSSRMVRSRKRWLALSLKNPMCGETTGGKGFHLQVCVCVCELASALTFGASGPVVCASATSVCLCLCILACLHLCILSMSCRDVQGSRAQSSQSMKWWNAHVPSISFTNAGPDWAWLHDTSVHRGIRVSLPSCLPVWFEGLKSLAAQSYIVLHSPIMFAESILMIPFRTLSVMSLGSNKQISVLICMSFKHLHLYLEDIWAVCGTWRKWMNRVV